MKRVQEILGSRFDTSIVVLGALVVTGMAILGITWRSVARQTNVADQIPFLVSGGFAGVGLVGVGTCLLVIQHRRLCAAREGEQFSGASAAAADLVGVLRSRPNGECT